MTKEEKFAIWDATQPTIEEVRAYLNRMCGITPLPLVYFNNKEHTIKVVQNVLSDELSNLVGILLDEKTMLHLKAFTKDDFLDESFPANYPNKEQIIAWVNEHFSQFLNARPAREEDISVLKKKKQEALMTFEILGYHGVDLPNPCWKHLGALLTFQVKFWDGAVRISYYLARFGDLPVFSDYSDEYWSS